MEEIRDKIVKDNVSEPVPSDSLCPDGSAPESKASEGTAKEPEKSAETASEPDTPGDSSPNKQKTKKKHGKATALWTAFSILLVAAAGAGAAFLYGSSEYRVKFFPNTTVNGHDVSGMDAEAARQVLKSDLEGYSLTIHEKDGEDEILSADDIGWRMDDQGGLDQLISAQDSGHWYREIRNTHEYEAELIAVFDFEAADKAIMLLDCMKTGITPVDAALVQNGDGTLKAIPEVEGTKLDQEAATDAIFEALMTGAESVDLTDPDCYLHPEVTLANSNIERRADEWNRLITKEIKLSFGADNEVIDARDLKPHIHDDGETVTVDTDWIDGVVIGWAEKYNSYGRARAFTAHDGTVIDIPAGGSFGRYLDVSATALKIRSAISGSDESEVEPVWIRESTSWEENALSESYIEISLAEQKVYCYTAGKEIASGDCISGNPTFGRETPTGIYAVSAKKSDVEAPASDTDGRGEAMQFELELENGPAIGDASWRTTFGANLYETEGTHGNVYVSEALMKDIFDAVECGSAVVIY